jgi:hypothetical protein
MFIPMQTYYQAMDFTNDEIPNIANLMSHSMFGLVKEDLIGQHFNYGGVEYLKKFFSEVPNQGIIFYPTALGVELMMWAYGYGKKPLSDFFNNDIKFENEKEIICGNSIPVKK